MLNFTDNREFSGAKAQLSLLTQASVFNICSCVSPDAFIAMGNILKSHIDISSTLRICCQFEDEPELFEDELDGNCDAGVGNGLQLERISPDMVSAVTAKNSDFILLASLIF
jgi:hypothetical protein